MKHLLDSLRQEYRNHRMARFAIWVAAYGVALWVAVRTTGSVPGVLWLLLWLSLIPCAVYYIVRLIRFFKQRLLWSLRRRLIVTYIFIGVVPVLLILVLVVLGAQMLNGQFAAFLVTSKLRNHFDELRQLNRVVAHEAHLTAETTPERLLDHLQRFYVAELREHAVSYPGLQVTLRLGQLERAFRLDGKPIAKPVTVPKWLKREEFAGIVMDRDEIHLRAVDCGRTPVGDLTLVLSQPFTPELLDIVGAGIGPVGVLVPRPEPSQQSAQLSKPLSDLKVPTGAENVATALEIHSKTVQVPASSFLLDFTVLGGSTLDPIVWAGEKEEHLVEPVFLYASSRIVALNRQLLTAAGEFSGIYAFLFLSAAVVFLVIELFALVVGVHLTRSMTTTVDKLHDATERVKAADFSHRIGLPAGDQLSALGEAFDSMTASVESLLRESQEKSRLESEIEIARQVQTQLFPQVVPQVQGLRLHGICKPAQAVSGDYYDFLSLDENRVGLVLGDVSGKGISAALLMAAIQSALRAQFFVTPNGKPESAPVSTAEAVARLNRQLYQTTPMEKYVTFFYAVYDATTRKLTYTNAGHVPPLLFRRDDTERLTTGGTVVGLFSSQDYEQAELKLEPGDLLVAYTDGISEPESTYGEEFGEGRVIEAVRRARGCPPEALVGELFRSVSDWTGSPELQDDMTVVVAQAVP